MRHLNHEEPCLPRIPATATALMRRPSGIGVTSYCLRTPISWGALARQEAEIKQKTFGERNAAKERLNAHKRTCHACNPKLGCVVGQKPVKHAYTAFRRWA